MFLYVSINNFLQVFRRLSGIFFIPVRHIYVPVKKLVNPYPGQVRIIPRFFIPPIRDQPCYGNTKIINNVKS